jgi:hypothetical protein
VTDSGALAPEAVLRIDNGLGAHELAVDYDIDPSNPPGVYVVAPGPVSEAQTYEHLRFGRVFLVPGPTPVWVYRAADYPLESYAYKNVCPTIPGGTYTQGGPDLLDTNHHNRYIWSCVTRPDHTGARKVWACQTVSPADGGCNVLQWYEIAPEPVSITTSRYTLPDGDHVHDPSMAVNSNTDVVIHFHRSYADPLKYPGIFRLTIPRGASATLTEEKPGPSVVYRPKEYGKGTANIAWADFSALEPDPIDDRQFFGHAMTVYDNGTGPKGVSEQWQSWLLRYVLVEP